MENRVSAIEETRDPLPSVTFEAGRTYGIYVDLTSYQSGVQGLRYTNGGPNVYENNFLKLTLHRVSCASSSNTITTAPRVLSNGPSSLTRKKAKHAASTGCFSSGRDILERGSNN